MRVIRATLMDTTVVRSLPGLWPVAAGTYRFEDANLEVDGWLSGLCDDIHPVARLYVAPNQFTIIQDYLEPAPLPRTMERFPLRCIADPNYRAEVAEARRRVALKRWLRNHNCPMPANASTPILRLLAQRIRAGLISL